MSVADSARRDLASDAAFLDGTSVYDAPAATYRLRTWVQTRIPALLAELDQAKAERDQALQLGEDIDRLSSISIRVLAEQRNTALATLQQVRPALEEADRQHEWGHYCEVDDVRCECCDLRYGERDEYTCCSQHGMHNHPHRFDDEELTAARGCAADCPPWYLPLLEAGS